MKRPLRRSKCDTPEIHAIKRKLLLARGTCVNVWRKRLVNARARQLAEEIGHA